MCAIAGIVGPDAARPTVKRMSEVQKHRGPDSSGVWLNPGVSLAHRRLSIIDISDAGHQPMTIENGRYTIVFNGEIYNYLELKREIGRKLFNTNSDTELLLFAYVKWGVKCLEKLKGMFAFAIWDSKERSLFCARDRFGIKPFYYSQQNHSFYFASEIKGFFAGGIEPVVNNEVMFDFLARDLYEHTENTFFHGIYKLPPGHWMIVSEGVVKNITSYWDFPERVKSIEVDENLKVRQETLAELLGEAVTVAIRSDVPIAVATSGGLDSATLLALLRNNECFSDKLTSFSFVFEEKQYSERSYVEELSQYFGGTFFYRNFNPADFIDSIKYLVYQLDEPFAGVPISAYSSLFREIGNQGFKVVMDGTGLDEGLAGYDRYVPAYWADLEKAGNHSLLRNEIESHRSMNLASKLAVFNSLRSSGLSNNDVGLAQDLSISARSECLNSDYINSYKINPTNFETPFKNNLQNIMYRELRYTKIPRALRFRDRISMSEGIELRPPFLDHDLVEYQFSLPGGDLISSGQQKVILRNTIGHQLPERIVWANKRSVQTPQTEWFRTDLKSWLLDEIDTNTFWELGWVDKSKAHKVMNEFFKGKIDNSFFLWQWANIKIWRDGYFS